MSVQEASVREYLASLSDWREIDMANEKVTIEGKTDGTRSKYGQTTAAFRHAKRIVSDLKHYTSPQESKLLKHLHESLLAIPDIDPSDLKDFRKLPKIISTLRGIGDFNKKQMAVLQFGQQWIEEKQCSATDEKMIQQAALAVAFLLKAIEHDLEKDLGKPLIKAKKIQLLTAKERAEHLDKVKALLKLLEKKPLNAAKKPKYEESLKDIHKKTLVAKIFDKRLIDNLFSQLKLLEEELDARVVELLSEKNGMLAEEEATLLDVQRYKKILSEKGQEGFWTSFANEAAFHCFLKQYLEVAEHDKWLAAFAYQHNLNTLQVFSQRPLANSFLWKAVQMIDSVFFYFLWGIDAMKNKAIEVLLAKSVNVSVINEVLDKKLNQLIDDYTQQGPNESISEDKTEYVLSYHDKRLATILALKENAQKVRLQLERKEVSKALTSMIKSTSWWLWLISAQYRNLTNTILNILHNNDNPSVERLRLVAEILQRGVHSKKTISYARYQLEQLFLKSFASLSNEQLIQVMPKPLPEKSAWQTSFAFFHEHMPNRYENDHMYSRMKFN